MSQVLKLTEDIHQLTLDFALPYEITVHYEDGTSETFNVTSDGAGGATITPVG